MIVLDGEHLRPADVASVARHHQPVALAEEAAERNRAARTAIAALIGRDEPLYGVTTGVGALRDRTIAEADRERLQWNLLRSHAVSAGPPLSPELVRAGMVVRANQLGAGGAGTAPELLDRLVAALNDNVTPFTRELGSLGTGDLPGLADVALALLGDGRVWRDGNLEDAPAPAAPVRLGLRDALGFMSSNALTVGRATLLWLDCRALHDACLAVAALSFEALDADQIVLSEPVQQATGAAGQSAVAARMRALLARPEAATPRRGRLVQDPYPFRVLPQVDGVCRDALDALEEVLGRELNARTENALIASGQAFPNGNFHAAELSGALDRLRAALAQSASLMAARVSALFDPRMSGLPPFLAGDPGPESGMMMVEYTAHAAAEARSLAIPMAAQSVYASLGVESHASLAATAARRTGEVLEVMRALVAAELAVAVRALRLGARTPVGAGTSELFAAACEVLPAAIEDRRFTEEIEAARGLLDHGPG
jgi:histidine ammonia-lyase